MIELTPEPCQALRQGQFPVLVRDPETNTDYVLLRSEVSDRLQALLEEDNDWVEGRYPHLMEVFGRAGWDDSTMDVYNDLDPRWQR